MIPHSIVVWCKCDQGDAQAVLFHGHPNHLPGPMVIRDEDGIYCVGHEEMNVLESGNVSSGA